MASSPLSLNPDLTVLGVKFIQHYREASEIISKEFLHFQKKIRAQRNALLQLLPTLV